MWPTKADPKIYKFNSFWFELRKYGTTIERETYSLLDWMGDIGGLYGGIVLIAQSMVSPIAAIAVKTEVFSQAFKISPIK